MSAVAQGGGVCLLSRLQARRLAEQLPPTGTVVVDFSGVAEADRPFCDEFFRVWPIEHPGSALVIVGASDDIMRLARQVCGRHDLPQPGFGMARA